MKKILIIFPVLATIMLSGCLKDKPNVDFSAIGAIAEITSASTNSTPNAPSGGIAFFPGATLSFAGASDPDTVSFTVNIASDYAPTKDVPITLAIDQAALTAYNADAVHNSSGIQFALFPDSTMTIPSLTGTVKAGNNNRLATFYVIFHPSKIDPTQTYMLPLTIKSATGVTISGNLQTIYFHVIGNPLAGAYNNLGSIRYNYSGQVSYSYPGAYPPNVGTLNLAAYYPKSATPDNPTTIEIPYSNLGSSGWTYVITIDPVSLAITNVALNATGVSQSSNFVVYYSNYNPATKTIHIISHYNNALAGAGNDRIIDETMVHQ